MVTDGGHLKLKEEKAWGKESEAILNNYLALDLKLLAEGLDCIPFYQRHELSTNLFSVSFSQNIEPNLKNCDYYQEYET